MDHSVVLSSTLIVVIHTTVRTATEWIKNNHDDRKMNGVQE